MISARPFYFAKDYDMLCSWWKSHGWDAVPAAFLPAVGIVITDGEKDLAAGFLKMETTTPIGMLEWSVTNPENAGRESIKALAELMESAKVAAKAMGRTVLFTYCKQPSLARLYEKAGFQTTDKEMIHLVCNL